MSLMKSNLRIRLRSSRVSGPGILALILMGTLCACSSRAPEVNKKEPAQAVNAPVQLSHAARLARLDQGKALFKAECSACHGERGRGDGVAAASMEVRPRDFTREPFRYRSTESGEPPRREDVLETITRGMPGTAMPSFRFLSDDQLELLVDYVLHLANVDPAAKPAEVTLIAESPETADSLAKGKAVYLKQGCEKCHGVEGAGDGPSAKTLKDALGFPIASRNLRDDQLRRGQSVAEVVRALQTGLDGTPMPAFTDGLSNDQVWDMARFVLSLQKPKAPLPEDLVARGRHVIQERRCTACHTIEGQGGRVGPSLDVSSQKLRFEWVKEFLKSPREFGKIYPFTPWRMPDLGLQPEEIEGVLALFGEISGRGYPEKPEPVPAVATELASKGKLFYFLKCTECHNLGNVVSTPLAKQQGPDLIHITKRLRYDWIPKWVEKPQAVYPGTTMIDTNLTPEEIEAVRAFLWEASSSSAPSDSARAKAASP